MRDIIEHYDRLIDEGHDPVCDPEVLRCHMDGWDGQAFLDALKSYTLGNVLEIGVGTGRLAVRVAPLCQHFTGIDLSSKTLARAAEHLAPWPHVTLLCGDFMHHPLPSGFDVIYSSLTFMHIPDKRGAIERIANLLAPAGRLVLSIDKNQQPFLQYGNRTIRLFPDCPDNTLANLRATRLCCIQQFETDFAHVFCAQKPCDFSK